MRTRIQTIAATLIALLTVGSAWSGQEKLAAAMRETREEIVQTRDQLQMTVDAISALVNQKKGDLKPNYDTFVSQVARTQSAAVATRARAKRMGEEADTHFSTWKTELEGINNPSLQKKATKRLQSVQKSYEKVTKQINDAADKFNPYLSDLADMQKMLANDLTPNGVKNLRGTVSNAKFHLQGVRSPIYDSITELDRMQKALSSSAGN